MAVYHLRQRDGTNVDRVILARDDSEALTMTSSFRIDQDSELRCGERCVALFAVGREPLMVNVQSRGP